MDIIAVILIVLLAQSLSVIISAVINQVNCTRIPKGLIDSMKLTFAPYVIYCMVCNKDKLK